MIFLLFQILDLLTAFVLITAQLGWASTAILLYHGSYLLAKGGWYWTDPLSWMDIIVGLYIILMALGVRSVFSYVAAAFFLYKFALYIVYN